MENQSSKLDQFQAYQITETQENKVKGGIVIVDRQVL